MKDQPIQDYFKQSIRLIKSCVFKIDEIYLNYSFHNFVKFNRKPPTKENSKYYNNLAGIRTTFDPDVLVLSPLIGEYISLTKDVLINDPLLREIIEKYDKEYDLLIDKYPYMKTYVDGCIITKPYTISNLINDIENHSLLYINKDMLDEYEINIIKDIEYFVNNFFSRWFNPGYMVDELYLPGFLNNMYNGLVLYILFIKLRNVFSYSVDDFHLNNFLASYKNLDKYVTIFDKETKLWIYGNLKRLKHYIGHNSTLDSLMQNVWGKNKYGIGEFVYDNKKNVINEQALQNSNIETPLFNRDYTYVTKKKNDSFFELNNNTYNVEELNNILKDNKTIPDFYRLNDTYDTFMSKLENITNSNTKNFILDRPERIKNYSINRFNLVVSNLLHILKYENFQLNNFDYVNRVNGKIYKLTAKDIYNLIIYGIYKTTTDVDPNFTLILYGVFDYPDKKQTLQNTWNKNQIESIFDFLLPDILKIKKLKSYALIKKWFTQLKDLEPKTWYLISNITDTTIRTDTISIINQCFKTDLINVNIDTLEKELVTKGIDDFYEFESTIQETLTYFLESLSGVDLEPYNKILELYDLTKGFFTRTTSYSIILLTDYNFKDVINTNDIKNSVNLGYKPMIEPKKGYWERSEHWPADMHGSLYKEHLDTYETNGPKLISDVKEIENFMYYRNDDIYNSKDAILYSKRFPTKKYKIKMGSVTFEDTLPKLEQKDKTLNTIILDKPKINPSSLPSIVNDNKFSEIYNLGKYTKNYVVPNRKPHSLQTESDEIRDLRTNKISKVYQEGSLKVSNKPDYITDELDPWYNDIGYPKELKVDAITESVLGGDIDNVTNEKSTIASEFIHKEYELNTMEIFNTNITLKTYSLSKYNNKYIVPNRKPHSLQTETDEIRNLRTNKITKIHQDGDLKVIMKNDYITDELDPWYNDVGYPKITTIESVSDSVIEGYIENIDNDKSNLDSEVINNGYDLSGLDLIDINKTIKTFALGKYKNIYTIPNRLPHSIDMENDKIRTFNTNKITRIHQDGDLKVIMKNDYITDELDPWYNDIGYPKELTTSAVTDAVIEGFIENNNTNLKSNLDIEKIKDNPDIDTTQPYMKLNNLLIVNNESKYFNNLKIDQFTPTFVPNDETDIERVKQMKKYYSIGTGENKQVLISNVDDVNDYRSILTTMGYIKSYKLQQTITNNETTINELNKQNNNSSTETIDNINTNTTTDDVNKQ